MQEGLALQPRAAGEILEGMSQSKFPPEESEISSITWDPQPRAPEPGRGIYHLAVKTIKNSINQGVTEIC